MTLKLGRCVWAMYLHVCAKCRGSRVDSLGENPFGGFYFCHSWYFFKISSKFLRVQVLFLNQHILNRVSLPADDWRQQSLFSEVSQSLGVSGLWWQLFYPLARYLLNT